MKTYPRKKVFLEKLKVNGGWISEEGVWGGGGGGLTCSMNDRQTHSVPPKMSRLSGPPDPSLSLSFPHSKLSLCTSQPINGSRGGGLAPTKHSPPETPPLPPTHFIRMSYKTKPNINMSHLGWQKISYDIAEHVGRVKHLIRVCMGSNV